MVATKLEVSSKWWVEKRNRNRAKLLEILDKKGYVTPLMLAEALGVTRQRAYQLVKKWMEEGLLRKERHGIYKKGKLLLED